MRTILYAAMLAGLMSLPALAQDAGPGGGSSSGGEGAGGDGGGGGGGGGSEASLNPINRPPLNRMYAAVVPSEPWRCVGNTGDWLRDCAPPGLVVVPMYKPGIFGGWEQ